MDTSVLREIGLTESEIKVYTTVLDLGDSSKGKIVNESGITGSKVYEVLERLRRKGLITTYLQNKIKHFKAAHPNQLLNYLDGKKQNIQKSESKVQDILPQLLAKFEDSKQDQQTELFFGLKGLEIIFREQLEMLNEGETNYVIGGTRGTDEVPVLAFFEKIHHMRADKKIKTRMLYNVKQKEMAEEQFSKYKYTKIKYISHTSPVAINIYKNKTVIIIFGETISSIMITSQEVAQSFKEHFDMLWHEGK